jgi:hypothetical protein
MHGKYDPLIPLADAQKLYDELVNSACRKLMIFDEETLGVLHCQDDTSQGAVAGSGDWLVDIFGLDIR